MASQQKSSPGLVVCSLNANGIRSADKKGFKRWLKRRSPDVLCLQELRATPEQVPDDVRSPPGYNARWVCAEKKGYSGVATYSKAPADRHAVGSGLSWGDAEGRVLVSELPELTALNVYIPSGSSGPERQQKKFEYLDHFLRFAKQLAKSGRPAVLCGDVNIAHTELDIHNPKGNAKNSGFLPEERDWFGKLLEAGWVDVLRAQHPDAPGLYSWWSNRGRARELDRGWRIDYVLATPDLAERVTKAWIDKRAGLSDHAPVLVEFE